MLHRKESASRFRSLIEELVRSRRLDGVMLPDVETGLLRTRLFDFDAYAFAEKLPMPVLVLVGAHDSEIDIENAERFSVTVPRGHFSRLEQSGHFPFLEQTSRLAAEMLAFLHEEGL